MQTNHVDSKTQRIDARVRPEDKELFKRAAALSGIKLSEFTIRALKEAASKIIKEHTMIELSLEDQRLFIDKLINAEEPNSRLLEAAKRFKKLKE